MGGRIRRSRSRPRARACLVRRAARSFPSRQAATRRDSVIGNDSHDGSGVTMGAFSSRVAIAASVWVALSAAAPPARAQSSDDKLAAEALFEQGRKLLADGDVAEACPKLAASNRL